MLIDQNSDRCQFDFFIDTWDLLDWRSSLGPLEKPDKLSFKNLMSTMGLYNPTQIRIQKNLDFDTSEYVRYVKQGDVKKNSRGEHILGMYYKILKANALKAVHEVELRFRYDLVIRHRTDFGLKDPLVITDDLVEKCQSTIFVAQPYNKMPSWRTDVFALSSSKNMDYYSSLFARMDDLVHQNQIFRPEILLYHHLEQPKNLQVEVLPNNWEIIYENESDN